jgi:BirA family biotin operon repressor/biotin-[acetyl-CoA-carboxylase] ligase
LITAPLDIRRIEDGLVTQRLGGKIHYFLELDSTNSYARGLAGAGAPEGEIVIAETQTQGRGRLGRAWVSPPYVNLYLSLILRPHRLRPADAPQITLTAAVAVADAVACFTPVGPEIKWPNDVLIGGKKVAGILCESSCAAERIDFVILGIGINLNYSPELMPAAIRERATSLLAIDGKVIEREAFVRRLIQDLDRCYGELEESGFGPIALRWEGRFNLQGKKVRVEMADGQLFGTAAGIDRDGALVVVDSQGRRQRVIAGDVIPVGEPE